MSDITMCPGGSCPWKANCKRHTAQPDPIWQSWMQPPWDGKDCATFWPTENKPAPAVPGNSTEGEP